MCWPDRLGRLLLQCWWSALTNASLEPCVEKWRGWEGFLSGESSSENATLQSQLAFALDSKHVVRVQRRGSASQRANQSPRGWRSAVFLKSIEKCDNSWILCSSSPFPSFPRFWEHENSLSLMKSGRLSQLQWWDMSGHKAHYTNFLHNGLTPGHSCQGQSIKSRFTNPHFPSKLFLQGKFQPQQPYSSLYCHCTDRVQSNCSMTILRTAL